MLNIQCAKILLHREISNIMDRGDDISHLSIRCCYIAAPVVVVVAIIVVHMVVVRGCGGGDI